MKTIKTRICFIFLWMFFFSVGEAFSEKKVLSIPKDEKNAPIYITSQSLSVESGKRQFTYSGNVVFTRGSLTIKSKNLIGNYDDRNKITDVLCKGDVKITKKEGMKAKSNKALYDVKNRKIILSESPNVEHNGNILSANKITIFLDEDRSEAEGNVRVSVVEQKGKDALGRLREVSKN